MGRSSAEASEAVRERVARGTAAGRRPRAAAPQRRARTRRGARRRRARPGRRAPCWRAPWTVSRCRPARTTGCCGWPARSPTSTGRTRVARRPPGRGPGLPRGGRGARRERRTDWPLGLARLAQALGRDLQRAARAAGGPERLWRGGPGRPRAAGCGAPAPSSTEAHRARAGDRHGRRRAPPRGRRGRPRRPARRRPSPAALRQLPDPPFGLFARGRRRRRPWRSWRRRPWWRSSAAGARRPQGLAFARDLAAELGRAGAPWWSAGWPTASTRPPTRARCAPAGPRWRCSAAASTCPTRGATATSPPASCERGALVSEFWPGHPARAVALPGAQPDRGRPGRGGRGGRGRAALGRPDHGRLRAGARPPGAGGARAGPGRWPRRAATPCCARARRCWRGPTTCAPRCPARRGATAAPAPAAGARRPGGAHPRAPRARADGRRAPRRGARRRTRPRSPGALALLEVEGVVVRGDGQRYWATPPVRAAGAERVTRRRHSGATAIYPGASWPESIPSPTPAARGGRSACRRRSWPRPGWRSRRCCSTSRPSRGGSRCWPSPWPGGSGWSS